MSFYDLSNPLDKANFILRANKLAEGEKIVELKEKKPRRTLNQNSYLHICLSYFASQTGNRMEWVKQQYFKKTVNPSIFIRQKEDKLIGTTSYLRSSADLDTEEMTTAVERFRNWASMEAGIYIPSPEEHLLVSQMETEIERNKEFI